LCLLKCPGDQRFIIALVKMSNGSKGTLEWFHEIDDSFLISRLPDSTIWSYAFQAYGLIYVLRLSNGDFVNRLFQFLDTISTSTLTQNKPKPIVPDKLRPSPKAPRKPRRNWRKASSIAEETLTRQVDVSIPDVREHAPSIRTTSIPHDTDSQPSQPSPPEYLRIRQKLRPTPSPNVDENRRITFCGASLELLRQIKRLKPVGNGPAEQRHSAPLPPTRTTSLNNLSLLHLPSSPPTPPERTTSLNLIDLGDEDKPMTLSIAVSNEDSPVFPYQTIPVQRSLSQPPKDNVVRERDQYLRALENRPKPKHRRRKTLKI